MRGPDQFFRVRARFTFEAAGEAVGVVVQGAALGRDRALAVLDTALPFGRSGCRRHGDAPSASMGAPFWRTVASKECHFLAPFPGAFPGALVTRRPALSPAAPPAPP